MNHQAGTTLSVTAIKQNLQQELEGEKLLAEGLARVENVGDLKKVFWSLTDHEFIERAYLLILDRAVDVDGLQNYLEKLGSLRISRPEILVALRYSSEGRRLHKKIPGFFRGLLVTLVCRLPLINYLIRSFLLLPTIAALRGQLAAQLQIQQQLQQQQITDLQDDLSAKGKSLTDLQDDLSAVIKNLTDMQSVDAELYQAFEDVFRGEPQLIKKRLQVYLPFLDEVKAAAAEKPGEAEAVFFTPVALDLGCGRGEWLELLEEQGFAASGVDSSPVAVATCQQHNLQVTVGDALAFLRDQADASIDFISAFHLFEHLHTQVMFDLLAEIYRVLAPGGRLLLETPNPTNILVSSYDFYRDPTHKNPLHPDSLLFFARYFRFSQVEGYYVDHTNPEGSTLTPSREWSLASIDDYIKVARDFTLIGCKCFST